MTTIIQIIMDLNLSVNKNGTQFKNLTLKPSSKWVPRRPG